MWNLTEVPRLALKEIPFENWTWRKVLEFGKWMSNLVG